jgi:hypothetical protein
MFGAKTSIEETSGGLVKRYGEASKNVEVQVRRSLEAIREKFRHQNGTELRLDYLTRRASGGGGRMSYQPFLTPSSGSFRTRRVPAKAAMSRSLCPTVAHAAQTITASRALMSARVGGERADPRS